MGKRCSGCGSTDGVAPSPAPSMAEVIAAALEALEDNDNHAATVILKTAQRCWRGYVSRRTAVTTPQVLGIVGLAVLAVLLIATIFGLIDWSDK